MTCRPPLALAFAAAALGVAWPRGAEAVAGAWVDHGEARVRLVSSRAEAAPGGDAGLGVEFALRDGWHVYWKNAGDAGYAPRLAVSRGLAPGATLRFPAPGRFEFPGGLVAFGFEREVVYPVEGRLDPAVVSGAAAIAARIDYLVCAETCIPHTAELELSLPVGVERRDPETAPPVERWRARLPLDSAAPGAPTVRARLENGPGAALELVLALEGAGRAASPDLFFEADALLALDRPRFLATAEGPAFRVPVRVLDPTRPLPERLRFAWTATGFERAAEAAAFEGVIEVPRPRSRRIRTAFVLAALALGAAALISAAFARHRRAPTSNP